MRLQRERELLVRYGRQLGPDGLCGGTSGNLSVYLPDMDCMLITPSGVDYAAVRPEDMVVMDLEGNREDGQLRPSSEWQMHALFYRWHPQARAVVHTHSPYCTTLACLDQPILPIHAAVAAAGGDSVPCAPYRLFGTPELAQAAVESCGEGKAVLLGNHGLVAWDESLPAAYALARDLEFAARLQWQAQCVGTARLMSSQELEDIRQRLKSYGQR